MRLVMDIGNKYLEIIGSSANAFARELTVICAGTDFSELVLDFQGTSTINPMTIGTLFAMYQKLREQGRMLRLINISDKVRRLLRIVALEETLTSASGQT